MDCILPIKEIGRLFHLCRSDFTLIERDVKFSSRREQMELVIITPKYLNLEVDNLNGILDCGSSRANWLTGKHSLFCMFNLYPETVPKDLRVVKMCGMEIAGLET